MNLSRKIIRKIWKSLKFQVSGEIKRCTAINHSKNRCIKQCHHIFWHEDAWKVYWW